MKGKNTPKARVEIHTNKKGEKFMNIKSANNKKVATSGEGYKSTKSIDKAIKVIKKAVKNKPIDKTKKKK